MHPDLPGGLWSGRTVYYHTEWFTCAAAVYALPEGQAGRIRAGGLATLTAEASDQRYGPWQPTPAFELESNDGIWRRNLGSGLSCLTGSPDYHGVFSRLAYQPGAFFAVSDRQAVVIVAPTEGLVFYSGYE